MSQATHTPKIKIEVYADDGVLYVRRHARPAFLARVCYGDGIYPLYLEATDCWYHLELEASQAEDQPTALHLRNAARAAQRAIIQRNLFAALPYE